MCALLTERIAAPAAPPPDQQAPPPLCSSPLPPPAALQDGVVLGADTRSTAGTTVADKNCEKIHYIAPNIYCCGAGTAADTENVRPAGPLGSLPGDAAPQPALVAAHRICPQGMLFLAAAPGRTERPPMGRQHVASSQLQQSLTSRASNPVTQPAIPASPHAPPTCLQVTGMVASQLELHRYATGTQSRVITAMTLLKSHLFRCGGRLQPAASCAAGLSAGRRRLRVGPVLLGLPAASICGRGGARGGAQSAAAGPHHSAALAPRSSHMSVMPATARLSLRGPLCSLHPPYCARPSLHPPTQPPTNPRRRRYQGHVSAALVLGGVDFRGPHLFTVYPHGSTDSLPFCTMGSGRWVQ